MAPRVCELLCLRIILNNLKVASEVFMIFFWDNKLVITLLTIQFSMIEPIT